MLDFFGPMTPRDWHTSAQVVLAAAQRNRRNSLQRGHLAGPYWKDCYRRDLIDARIRLQAKGGILSETAAFNQIANLQFSEMGPL